MVVIKHSLFATPWCIKRWIHDGISDDVIMIVGNQWAQTTANNRIFNRSHVGRTRNRNRWGYGVKQPLNRW